MRQELEKGLQWIRGSHSCGERCTLERVKPTSGKGSAIADLYPTEACSESDSTPRATQIVGTGGARPYCQGLISNMGSVGQDAGICGPFRL